MAARDRLKNLEKVASFLAYERDVHSSFDGRIQRHLSSGRFLISAYLVCLLLSKFVDQKLI